MPSKKAKLPTPKAHRESPAPSRLKHEMILDFDGLMRLVAGSLYSEKKIFIRELIQNGHDGIRRREKIDKDLRGRIDIETRRDEGWISFTDNGIGMSKDDLHRYLSRIGASGTKQLGGEEEQVSGLVGQFGIGFLSGFIVAAHVEVRTRKADDDQGWLWRNEGGKSYTVEPCDVKSPGTSVKVVVKDPIDRILLEPGDVINVVREFCDMLRVPIHVNLGSVAVNAQEMPWEQSGITEEQCADNCKQYLMRMQKVPEDVLLGTFPVRLDSPFEAGGVLYIRKPSIGLGQGRPSVLIFQDRMYVNDDAELLPPWADFVSGIVETAGLTPNAARDGFIKNHAWSQLREALGELIIQAMDVLHKNDRKRFSRIFKFHDRRIKEACSLHEPFFAKFAHLLEWRVNVLPNSVEQQYSDEQEDIDLRPEGVSFRWSTLPEVLAATPGEERGEKKLLAFTTANASYQYFEMANAKGVQIVNASYEPEDELISAYLRLPDVPPVELVFVDKQQDALFEQLLPEDQDVRRLAEAMGQVILVDGISPLRVEAHRFQPETLSAVILNAERSRAEREARLILNDENQPSNLREMAKELIRKSRSANAVRMNINAASPFIQALAKQNFKDPSVRHLMQGVYHSALLYNADVLTPRNTKNFRDQFGEFMQTNLNMLAERVNLELEREAIRSARRAKEGPDSAKHRIFFLMMPYKGYSDIEKALRVLLEDRWNCQLILARDRHLDLELLRNVEKHMDQAHAFLAEITEGNGNVMYEVGRARALYPEQPMVFLSHPIKSTDEFKLPADLCGLLRMNYRYEDETEALSKHFEIELRKSIPVAALLDDARFEHFISPAKLMSWCSNLKLSDAAFVKMGQKYATPKAWKLATAGDVYSLLLEFDKTKRFAGHVLETIHDEIEKRVATAADATLYGS